MTDQRTMKDPSVVRPVPHASVATAFLSPEAVLFDDRHGEIHHLNPSASAVWLMVDGELSIHEITAELSDIFEVPESAMLPDVEAAIADFRGRGLLDGSEQAAEPDAPALDPERDEAPGRLETLARPPDT